MSPGDFEQNLPHDGARKVIRNYKVDAVAAGAAWQSIVAAQSLFVEAANTDDDGHGTHVAGTAAGTGEASQGRHRGHAPGAQLFGFSVIGHTNVNKHESILGAFEWILQNHEEWSIRVVTNSWGYAPGTVVPRAFVLAVESLVREDLLVLFAAGNDGRSGTNPFSDLPGVLGVANYNDRDRGNLAAPGAAAPSSSRGRGGPGSWPDLAAPGTRIISARASSESYSTESAVWEGFAPSAADRYMALTGTSMATPAVAGAAALLFEANPRLSAAQAAELLIGTADLPPGMSYDEDGRALGRGVVDASEAVAAALLVGDDVSTGEALAGATVSKVSGHVRLNDGASPALPHEAIPYWEPAAGAAAIHYNLSPSIWVPRGGDLVRPGDELDLWSLGVVANSGLLPVTSESTVLHVVLDGETVVAGPVEAEWVSWSDTATRWTVPTEGGSSYRFRSILVDGEQGHFLAETSIRVAGRPG